MCSWINSFLYHYLKLFMSYKRHILWLIYRNYCEFLTRLLLLWIFSPVSNMWFDYKWNVSVEVKSLSYGHVSTPTDHYILENLDRIVSTLGVFPNNLTQYNKHKLCLNTICLDIFMVYWTIAHNFCLLHFAATSTDSKHSLYITRLT